MAAITGITLHRLRMPLDPPFRAAWDPVPRTEVAATVVEVSTDDGRTGVGGGDALHGALPALRPLLGLDPRRVETVVGLLEGVAFHGTQAWPVEAAVWDLLGQEAGLPVSVLLGGASDRVPAYASTGELADADERVRRCRAAAEAGFRAVKLRVDPAEADQGIEIVAAVRAALPDVALMVDLNQGWRMPGDLRAPIGLAEAVGLCRRLAAFDVTWVEEPLPMGDPASLAALRRQGDVTVAGGEMVRTFDELVALLDADALDVVQADVVLSAGLRRGCVLAQLARSRGRRYTPHTWSDGLGLLANLHVTAGVGGGPFLEVPHDPPGWSPARRDHVLRTPLAVDAAGDLVVPDAPGLGVDLDRDLLDDLTVAVERIP